MIEWALVLISLLHISAFVYLLASFAKLPIANSETKESYAECTFSIIVPVRNEAEKIERLLESIEDMYYDPDDFEVLLVDDSSEDHTLDVVNGRSWNFDLKVFSLNGQIGKKAAIEKGVGQAENDVIITTDGDCLVPKTWLQSFRQSFKEGVQLVVGPVRMNYSGLFGALQSFDFSILIGYAASLVGMGIPSMSNGANLAYRREVFNAVNGYAGNQQIPSGDDEFLLLKVAKKYPDSIRFSKNSESVVSTEPKGSFADLLNQRVRWLSKWTLHKNPKIIVSVLGILIDNLSMIALILGLIIGFLPSWILVVFIGRFLIKGFFSARVNRLLRGRTHWLAVLVYEFIYPFYVLLLSFASIFGHYTWKGRTY